MTLGKIKKIKYAAASMVMLALLTTACQKERSGTTAWAYNSSRNGGFEKVPYIEQETGPGLVLIQGGRFTMGRTEQDVTYSWNSIPRTVTVSSFYMDEVEVTNLAYTEYLYWLNRVYKLDFPEVYRKALPDTNVWRNKLAYNEPYVNLYLRHPAYRDYPVVGVSWVQATNFCNWRTDRVNEFILIREGLLKWYPNQIDDDHFDTQAYLAGQYESSKRIDGLKDYDPNKKFRNVKMSDGILLPRYRLPTEAEWEYAAYGLIGNTIGELVVDRKKYPWNGHAVRNADDRFIGQMLANFKRGRGDNMGVAGKLNDAGDITTPVYSYWPNDYGLYNMAGNVSEWVMDVYRPLSTEDMSDFRPFRGNVFQEKVKNQYGELAEKDSLGRMKYRRVDEEKDNLKDRRNYREADERNFDDGDQYSSIYYEQTQMYNQLGENDAMYQSNDKDGAASLITNESRVYKGGSWKDRAYYLSPGTRRFLDQNRATDYIGFRCAMTRIGSPIGLGGK